MKSQIPIDALTGLLDRIRIDAQLYKHRDYCGDWAIDTSGSGLIPFHFIDKGSGWLHVKGLPPQLLQAGDFVLFPRDLPHQISNEKSPPQPELINTESSSDKEGAFTSILCGFYECRSPAIQPLLDDLPGILLITNARNNPTTAGIGYVIDAALLELEHDSPGRSSALRDLARLLFLHVLRDRIAKGQSEHFLAALGDKQIGKALSMIHNDYGRELTLETLAQASGMSRSAFCDKFNALVGTSPNRYLTTWRMQEATTLLESTELSVEQIAERCGYR
ncbi:MAG: AraC family transcriptional regulator, partial [Chromatiales bacterium]|nr:AraC family transcriptional regulator [Chromatiales bacterium]